MQTSLQKLFLLGTTAMVFFFQSSIAVGQAPQFIAGSISNVTTTPITVPITVKNFNNLLACQWSLNWDSTKLKFSSTNSVHPQLFGMTFSNPLVGTNQGKLGFVWVDGNGLVPQTITDNSVAFNIVFNVPTTISGAVDIVFGDVPTSLLVSDASLKPVPGITFIKGVVTIPFPLPLVLTQFTGSTTTAGNVLSWSTAQETNTGYFEVEKSGNGSSYTVLGKVTAAGYSSSAKSYSYTDAATTGATVYYRLKQVDKDGSFTYSNTIAVTSAANAAGLGIYPNPVKETLFAQVQNDKAEKVTVQITDFLGKVLLQQSLQLSKGSNNFSLSTMALAKGSYLLVVKGEKTTTKQFIKE